MLTCWCCQENETPIVLAVVLGLRECVGVLLEHGVTEKMVKADYDMLLRATPLFIQDMVHVRAPPPGAFILYDNIWFGLPKGVWHGQRMTRNRVFVRRRTSRPG